MTLKILMVEDRAEDAFLVLETLRRAGYSVEFERVEDAGAMRQALEEKPWDLVISDYRMPSFSGPEAIMVLKESGRDIPLLVVSGTIGEDVAVETLKKGANDYLLKQNLTRLASAVDRALREAEQKREQRKAEKELRRAAQIFAQLQEAVLCTDCEGRITYWNEASANLTGWSAQEAIGEPVANFLSADVRDRWGQQILSRGDFQGQIEQLCKDGTRLWLDVHVTPFTDKAGNRRGFVGVARDITGQIRDRQALEKANVELKNALALQKELLSKAQAGERAKSEFLAVMSHEIRTPMNGILGFAGLLSESPRLTSDDREHLAIIEESGEALLRILDDILDHSRLEAERLAVNISPFDPRELARSVRELLAKRAREKSISLEIAVAESLPRKIHGDEGRVRQILLNLVGNAIKFTERGSVTLYLETGAFNDQPVVEYRVRDTGPGIAEEELEHIFIPFFQSDSSASRVHGGTGLGLSISRRLAELMGGTLSVKSTPGEGSEFIVRLPQPRPEPIDDHPKAPPSKEAPSPEPTALSSLRVLVVEDDKINLKLLQSLLRKLGFKSFTATNGREAVEIYNREQPNCVVMDLQMPEMDGIEATRQIRLLEESWRKGQAFIFALTANVIPTDRQRCFEAGMDGYLNKPVRMGDLVSMLNRAAESRR